MVLDGLATSVAALIATRLEPAAAATSSPATAVGKQGTAPSCSTWDWSRCSTYASAPVKVLERVWPPAFSSPRWQSGVEPLAPVDERRPAKASVA